MRRGLRGSFVLRRMGASRLLIVSVLIAIFITAALTSALVTFSTRALPQAARRELATAPKVSIAFSGQIGAAQAAADSAVIRSSLRATFGTNPVSLELCGRTAQLAVRCDRPDDTARRGRCSR